MILKKITFYILFFYISLNKVFAWEGLLNWVTQNNIREWRIHAEDIPNIIWNAIDFFFWIAWTIAIVFVIIWAYKILFWSLTQDKTKWKDTIVMAITWFVLAAMSWSIIQFILENINL
jgi:hypothetical protein